ncbi:Hypothetical protein R9X50_00693900 [Acrodontium crateriforme]|uniref:Serine-rich protein n=1 Tax=Acrodontium crateriforme TaxID=150365 RepID=A0AAQ3MAK1_9PEZI|nr:Hypothetical protein R9X50_00693900 [Acrodontium crateriforme]
MFLDPEPKRSKHGHVMSTLPSQRPPATAAAAAAHRQPAKGHVRRKPLQERSKSQNNQQTPTKPTDKLSLSLTKGSPRPTSAGRSNHGPRSVSRPKSSSRPASLRSIGDGNSVKNAQLFSRPLPRLPSPSIENASTPIPAPASWIKDRSDASTTPANQLPALEFPPRVTLFPKTSNRSLAHTALFQPSAPITSLAPVISKGPTHDLAEDKLSDDLEVDDLASQKVNNGQDDVDKSSLQPSELLDDTAAERSIRIITGLEEIPVSPNNLNIRSQAASIVRTSSTQSASDALATPRSKLSAKAVSTNSLQRDEILEEARDGLTSDPNSPFDDPDSPFIVIYGTDTPDTRMSPSSSRPLRVAPSIESIQARVQYPTIMRPEHIRPITFKTSDGSLASSNGTLPSLSIPRRRARDASNLTGLEIPVESANVDTDPFRRHQFDAHLSTILSESDAHSWIANRNHVPFSPASDGTADNEGNATTVSEAWPTTLRTGSASFSKSREAPSAPSQTSHSQDGPGDMTLGMFRQESAKPQPLFFDTAEGRKFIGEAPPLPPIPKNHDEENFDTVSELQSPALHPMRSNWSLRQRSNSTPSSLSRQQSQYSEHGGMVFPVWARNFYSGKWQLLSASKVSLALPNSNPLSKVPQSNGLGHQRSYSDLSVISRIGTGHSNADSEVRQEQFRQHLRRLQSQMQTPRASHWRSSSNYSANSMAQSIMSRPGTAYTDSAWTTAESMSEPNVEYFPEERPPARLGTYRDDGLLSPSSAVTDATTRHVVDDRDRIDSMEIFTNPLRMVSPSANGEDDEDVFTSRPRQWTGQLQGPTPPQHRSLQRPQTRRGLADETITQEPAFKSYSDATRGHQVSHIPHLMPSTRASQQGLSVWPPPSFVESLGTLLHSRCNRQISLFALGFVCPILWIIAAFLPLPDKPMTAGDLEKNLQGSEDYVHAAMLQHAANDPGKREYDERQWLKAIWWRGLNRIMSVVGILVIGAIVALVVVATH